MNASESTPEDAPNADAAAEAAGDTEQHAAAPEGREVTPGQDENRPAPPERPTYARLYEQDQLVSGRTRWSVGKSHRACSLCAEKFADEAEFTTGLFPPREQVEDSRDASEIFERLDICDRCATDDVLDSSFAHWRTTNPAPVGDGPKIVNTASLKVLFEQLGDEEAGDEAAGDDRAEFESSVEVDDAVVDDAPEVDEESDREDVSVDGESSVDLEASDEGESEVQLDPAEARERLRYLIGLFLVRKRVLRWVDIVDGRAVFEDRKLEKRYELEVPSNDEKLAAATREFEALFE